MSEDEPWEGSDHEISERLMQDDYEFGDGVEKVNSVEVYMNSRDFSINEVIISSNYILASQQCIRDTLRNIIRVTEYEKKQYSQDNSAIIGPKTKAKALRLYAESLVKLGECTLWSEDLAQIEKSFINPFWIAVHLDRAYQRSEEAVETFVSLLIAKEIIPNYLNNPEKLVEYLKNEMNYSDFYFRNVPSIQFESEDQMDKDFENSDTYAFENYSDKVYMGHKY